MKTEPVEITLKNLKRNGFGAEYFETADLAKEALLSAADKAKSVGFGGSVTLRDMGLYESLKEKGIPVFWHWKAADEKVPTEEMLRQAAGAELYLSGSNAITLDGRIVNIDGTGNRLSSMVYGHRELYIAAGVNKLVKNQEEAMIRIKNVACPQNARRLSLSTPCATLGHCVNCDSPQRMCNATLVLERKPGSMPVTVYLIGESLGY